MDAVCRSFWVATILGLVASPLAASPGDRIERRPIAACQVCGNLWSVADVAADADGNFVLVWRRTYQDEIRARRYTANGQPAGAEFIVASGSGPLSTEPSVAMAADGRFVVTWGVNVVDSTGSSVGTRVMARRFAADGAPRPGVLEVSSPDRNPGSPDVAMDGAGNFVIVWNDFDPPVAATAYARSYDATGAPRGPEFRVVGLATEFSEIIPRVAMGDQGQFVVVWQQKIGDAGQQSIRGRRYGLQGNAIGSGFIVAVATPVPVVVWDLAVAADRSGAFTVVYPRYLPTAVGWNFVGTFARRFSAQAVALAGEFRVSAPGSSAEGDVDVDVDADADGDFVVAWTDRKRNANTSSVHVRLYGRDGAALTRDRNFFQQPDAFGASVAMNAAGDFTTAWLRLPRNPPSVPVGPVAQRFAGPDDRRIGCSGFIATIVGTRAGETLHGTPGDDIINGLGGDDTLYGGNGADVLCGARGNDQVFGEAEWDVLSGGPDDDVLDGGTERDTCTGNGQVNADSAIQCEAVTGVP